MDREMLVNIGFRHLDIFWIIQELDELIRNKDPEAIGLLDNIFKGKKLTWREMMPFMRAETFVVQLYFPVSVIPNLPEEDINKFEIKPEYEMEFYENKILIEKPSPKDVFRVLRNALGHLADVASANTLPNIEFEPCITFRSYPPNNSKKEEVKMIKFATQEGFHKFINDFFSFFRMNLFGLYNREAQK
ncbi:MAG: hypothetical protein GC154_17365 [bacterium]|nr:hypothetical protein [bacterium]